MQTDGEVKLPPTAIVIFGGTGDLAQTKLLPSLYDLWLLKLLPENFLILALSRKTLTDTDYREFASVSIKAKRQVDEMKLAEFCQSIRYVSGNFSDLKAYEQIKTNLSEFDAQLGLCTNKLFYLAVPPNLYADIFAKLQESNAMAYCEGGWSRLLVEKPFGSNLDTAQALEEQLCALFTEDQIYRIDHYLAKDAIENIISLRFANSILADSWNGKRIESIDIHLFETSDVANRGAFYDGIGALRDVGQNHILQILALLTMKSADVHNAQAVRNARLEALLALLYQESDVVMRGQYVGYHEASGVNPDSQTETYFKIVTKLHSDEWQNVTVNLESGKGMMSSYSEAVITFKPTDECHCAMEPQAHVHKNILRIRFSPEQSIHLTMWIKEPGFHFKLHERELILAENVGEKFRSPEAYERVLYDCIVGDQTRFVSGKEVEAEWNFITPILEAFKHIPLTKYDIGSPTPFKQINN
jgi:glucose-6-phosphate 1-dehydrogenase